MQSWAKPEFVAAKARTAQQRHTSKVTTYKPSRQKKARKFLRSPSFASAGFLGRLVANLLAESCSSSSNPTCAKRARTQIISKDNAMQKPNHSVPMGQTSKSWSQAPAHGLSKKKLYVVKITDEGGRPRCIACCLPFCFLAVCELTCLQRPVHTDRHRRGSMFLRVSVLAHGPL